MKRNIIQIIEDRCNGCGLCIDACHEHALQLINGKAVLISDEYCDGLGACLPECPTDAIQMIERDAAEYNEELVAARQKEMKEAKEKELHTTPGQHTPCGCPGTRASLIKPAAKPAPQAEVKSQEIERPSQLGQWPIQLNLINPQASYLQNADILIAADCTAYAYASFHEKFMKDKITLIGCPKLDDNEYYTEKLAEILRINQPKSITVTRMSVPCCSGIVRAVKDAMIASKTVVPYSEVTITPDGQIL